MRPSLGEVLDQLERSRRLGFLGDGPVADHAAHALELLGAALRVGGGTVLDLGSGGGVPGLLALLEPAWTRVVLVDRSQRRCAFLRSCVAELGVGDLVDVVVGEAEIVARRDELRERADCVVARSFGPAAATVECAAPLVRVGGLVIVSDPPTGRSWPEDGLTALGLSELEHDGHTKLSIFEKTTPTDERFPRRAGVPARKPLWS